MKSFPSFSLPASDGETYSEEHFATGTTILYVYPKDMTSGCTIESQDFRDAYQELNALGVQVFGISKDSLVSHKKFCEKESLLFPLLSDENQQLMKSLGVWKKKQMYGREYFGAERSTFLIQDGKIIHEWRAVKVPGHVAEVLLFIRSL